ncbi:DUF4394 domain-containing protein [Streptomyces flavofungini]|uniref:DUF4394 domain-containing protein n=1 Tax=Streptomyces flavofungini TaxID=68200 RepID=UPI0025B0C2AD|nr:DUF4394 domain-containing protein [Streptomyces flavofungini]WJV47340.1 DUF4394 domain-containing protein [Streptomyces flavofungini]
MRRDLRTRTRTTKFKKSTRIVAALSASAACAALLAAAPGAGSATDPAASTKAPAATPSLRAFGILGGGTRMATFTTDRPDILDWVRVIKGLKGDTKLIGIDHRVQDGLMYGVGDQGGIYTIKTPPDVVDVVVTKVSQLQVALYGSKFGVDFNPAADRLRVISDNGQNLRHNLNDDSTAEDSVLTTPPIAAPTRGVTAAAYTNNDLNGATATTLFDINTTSDQVVIQSPANNGTLAPTGSLTLDAGADSGLDIFSYLTGGKTTSNIAFASLTPYGASTPSFYSVNVFTGEATVIEQFPLDVTDVTIKLSGS